ncbi:MAG TPA: hypothetical protein DDY68_00345 [Porphyromonadaceae bacterium]|nr:hypothetical protein [Porphyromonadaceae bacterium]
MKKNTSYTLIFWMCLSILLYQMLSSLVEIKLGSLRIETPLWNTSLGRLLQEEWVGKIFNLFCAFFGCFLIHTLNVQIQWCERESYYPTLVYALSLGLFFLSKDASSFLLCSILWIEWFYVLLTHDGKKEDSCSVAFNLSLLLSIISLIDISALLFYPLLFVGIWKINVYSRKSILLSLIGLLLPIFYFGFTCWFLRDTSFFISHFQAFPNLITWQWEDSYFCYMVYTIFSLAFMGWISYLTRKGEIHHSLRIKKMLEYIIILFLVASSVVLIGARGKMSSIILIHILSSLVIGKFLSYEEDIPHKDVVLPVFVGLYIFLISLGIWMF